MKIANRMRERLRRSSPSIAAALNFFLWGSGYLLNGRRRLLGFALVLFVLVTLSIAPIFAAFPTIDTYYALSGVFFLSLLFLSFAFARDAYLEAKKKER